MIEMDNREIVIIISLLACFVFTLATKTPERTLKNYLLVAVGSGLVCILINTWYENLTEGPEGKETSTPTPTLVESWGEWSDWTTDIPESKENRQIDQRETIIGYNMVVYVTQEAREPYYRNFRDYSIKDNLKAYGARESYSEKCFNLFVSEELLNSSKKYSQGTFIPYIDEEHVEGYNRGNDVAYVIEAPIDSEGRCYPFFVKDTETETQYRYRDKIN
ncbi:MAG: hypothetical protein IJE09_00800 [Oscillospiraceae bacterium]|nr:hypothetical protein [Oscillospiraceae bacterium]